MIKFLKTHADAVLPKKNNPDPSIGDSGYDMTAVEAIPLPPKQQECKHGAMILKEGIAKTGKSYYGYVCSAAKPDQCEARWAKLTAAGSWFFPSDSEGAE